MERRNIAPSHSVSNETLIQKQCLHVPLMATPLQKMLYFHANDQAKTDEAKCRGTNPAAMILQPARLLSSQKTGKQMSDFDNRSVRKTAAAIIEGGAFMWTQMLDHIHGLLSSGWKGLLIGTRRRYDETPLTLRVKDDTGAEGGNTTTKRCAKIMQSELHFYALLEHVEKKCSVQITGKTPTWLQCLQTTKAEQVSESQKEMMNFMFPNLPEVAKHFQFRHNLVCTDRFTANIVAEQQLHGAMAAKSEKGPKDNKFSFTHTTCNVHKVSGIEKTMSDIVAGHISGMVATGICMRSAGSVRELQQCL